MILRNFGNKEEGKSATVPHFTAITDFFNQYFSKKTITIQQSSESSLSHYLHDQLLTTDL